MLTVSVVFHIALNGGCSPLLCFHRSLAFVDKACIHQTDEALKNRGIENLLHLLLVGVVLYTKSYLQRLWTVYELASHLLLQPQGRIVMLDLDAAPTVISGKRLVDDESTTRDTGEREEDNTMWKMVQYFRGASLNLMKKLKVRAPNHAEQSRVMASLGWTS